MFGSGFKVRITQLREGTDRRIVAYRTPDSTELPRELKLWASCAVFNGEGEPVGAIELDVTDRRNVVFVGLEVEFDWS